MSSGRFHHRVTIQSFTETRGSDGGLVESWADKGQRWANIKPLKGDEQVDAQRVRGRTTHQITMPYYAGLAGAHRIVKGTRVFHIETVQNVMERSRESVAVCVELTD